MSKKTNDKGEFFKGGKVLDENDVCSKCGKEKTIRSEGEGWSKTTKQVCPNGHE